MSWKSADGDDLSTPLCSLTSYGNIFRLLDGSLAVGGGSLGSCIDENVVANPFLDIIR